MEKCTVEGGKFVQACDLLKRNTEQNHPVGKRKGIFSWALSSPSAGKTRTFYGSKSGEMVSAGMAFNFCPFCGADISAPFSEE